MKVEGTYTFDAPIEAVWQALNDPAVLVKITPGCERLEPVGENAYRGTLKAGVGPLQGQFSGTIALHDVQPPTSYRMTVDGDGPLGFVHADGQVRLAEQGASTLMRYTGDVQMGGRVAMLGQRVLDRSAATLLRQGLAALAREIRAATAC